MEFVIKSTLIIFYFVFIVSCEYNAPNKDNVVKSLNDYDLISSHLNKLYSKEELIHYHKLKPLYDLNKFESQQNLVFSINEIELVSFDEGKSHGSSIMVLRWNDFIISTKIQDTGFDEYYRGSDSNYFIKDSLAPTFLYSFYNRLKLEKLSQNQVNNEILVLIRNLLILKNSTYSSKLDFKALTSLSLSKLLLECKIFLKNEKDILNKIVISNKFKIIFKSEDLLYVYILNANNTNFESFVFSLKGSD